MDLFHFLFLLFLLVLFTVFFFFVMSYILNFDLGLFSFFFSILLWFSNMDTESNCVSDSYLVKSGLRLKMVLFIFSEMMFFLGCLKVFSCLLVS